MYLSMLMPRNEKLYVFGAWLGERFADNSKQLFLEACGRDGIRAVWIAKDEAVVSEVKSLGHEAYKWGTLKAAAVQLRAKYAIVSNGISDLEHAFLGRAVIIDLWHGIPLKKVCRDDRYEKDWDSPKQKFRDAVINVPLGRMHYVASSEAFVKIYQSAFGVKKEQITVLGQPRNDVFFSESKFTPYFPDRKIILYCPTHRKEGREKMRMDELLNLDRLQDFLERCGCCLVIKKHFYHRDEKENLDGYSRIVDITGLNVDVQRLIMESVALITDYSSIYIDYLLLNRPIFFYCYDYDEYVKKDREMYFEYDKVAPGRKAATFDELLSYLEDFAANGGRYGEEEREKIKNFFYCKKGQGPVSGILLDMIENGAFGR